MLRKRLEKKNLKNCTHSESETLLRCTFYVDLYYDSVCTGVMRIMVGQFAAVVLLCVFNGTKLIISRLNGIFHSTIFFFIILIDIKKNPLKIDGAYTRAIIKADFQQQILSGV